MFIDGVPDSELRREHSWGGPGRKSTLGYQHVPSGLVVSSDLRPDEIVTEVDRMLRVAMREKMIAAGLIDLGTRGNDDREPSDFP